MDIKQNENLASFIRKVFLALGFILPLPTGIWTCHAFDLNGVTKMPLVNFMGF